MREYLTSDDISNQISMMRSVFNGTIVVVEGVTDQRLFEKFIDKENVRLIQAHSKDKVKSTVKCMEQKRKDNRLFSGTLANHGIALPMALFKTEGCNFRML